MKQWPKLLIGDSLVLVAALLVVVWTFHSFWSNAPASQVIIKLDNKIIGTYDLNQTRDIQVNGHKGLAIIRIENGQARFQQSPCTNQYCVHQGWLKHAGEAAICLPNHLTLQLTGKTPAYDSLNY